MNDPDLPELALTEKEVDEILRSCDGRALLVGGQALAFWAQYYGIVPIDVLGENVTSDADFIGTAAVAREMAAALKSKGWRYWQPTMDSATPQTAKLSKRIEGKGIKQIDFLDSIIGLERERVMRRAVTLHLRDGTRLQLLHPLDVLESRLKNLAVLPSKRNRQGIAQARLAIDITRAFLEELVSEGKMRLLLTAIERVARIAQDKSLLAVSHDYELNVLDAVPADKVPSEEFRSRRWPQLLELVAAQRQGYAKRKNQGKTRGG